MRLLCAQIKICLFSPIICLVSILLLVQPQELKRGKRGNIPLPDNRWSLYNFPKVLKLRMNDSLLADLTTSISVSVDEASVS